MSIPTAHDAVIGDLADRAAGIQISLQTMRYANERDIPQMRKLLREQLQSYCDAVMAAAPDVEH